MAETTTTLGQRIKSARIAAGLTQTRLARDADVGPNALWGYETDRVEPRIATLVRMADVLGVDVGWLARGTYYVAGEAKR